MKNRRYCFIQDDSFHWYCVNIEDKEEFIKVLNKIETDSYNDEEYKLFLEKYKGNILGSPISNYFFENLKLGE